METWYKTTKYNCDICPVEVVKSTDKTVVVKAEKAGFKDRRHDITSFYETYHRTWGQAHAYLLTRAETNMEAARIALERAKTELTKVCSMREPT
jgi:hypothetical protein